MDGATAVAVMVVILLVITAGFYIAHRAIPIQTSPSTTPSTTATQTVNKAYTLDKTIGLDGMEGKSVKYYIQTKDSWQANITLNGRPNDQDSALVVNFEYNGYSLFEVSAKKANSSIYVEVDVRSGMFLTKVAECYCNKLPISINIAISRATKGVVFINGNETTFTGDFLEINGVEVAETEGIIYPAWSGSLTLHVS